MRGVLHLSSSEIASSTQIELDALRQRQLIGPVDGVGLAPHVLLPGIGAGFAPAAGFFFAAEGAADLGAGGADVHVGDAAVAARGRQEILGILQVGGEDGGGQALGHVVVHAMASSRVLIRHDVEDRGEGFGLDDVPVRSRRARWWVPRR